MNETKTANRGAVVVSGFIIALFAGLLYTWSLFVKPICEQYGWGTDQVALMGNVMLAAFCGGAAIGGNLLPKLGARNASLTGGLMFGLGVLVSSFVASPVLMYITWGLVAGLGCGILYTVGMYVTSAWFPDRRGLIMGIFLAIFGLSVTIFSKLLSSMLNGIGVKTTMLILGVILTVVISVIALTVMKMPPAGWTPNGKIAEKAADAAPKKELVSLSIGEALRTKEFWMFAIAFCIMVVPYAFISSYVTVYATDVKGFTAEQAITIVSMLGIGTAAGRFLGGVFADALGNKVSYAIFCLCSVAGGLLLLLGNGMVAISIAFILIAGGYGGRTPVYGVFPVTNFGPQNASALFGYGCIGTVISSIVAPLITVATREATGGYNTVIIIIMCISIVGMLCICLCPKVTPVMKKNGLNK